MVGYNFHEIVNWPHRVEFAPVFHGNLRKFPLKQPLKVDIGALPRLHTAHKFWCPIGHVTYSDGLNR